MTQFVSLLPAAPAAPAAAPATPGAVAPVTLQPPDLTSPNFLAQFKSALKNIANAVVLPQLTSPRPVAVQNGPLMSAVSDELPKDPLAVGPDKPIDVNNMPALLAELGFAIVPPVFLTPPPIANTVSPATAAPGPRIAPGQVAALPAVLTPGPQAEAAVPLEALTLVQTQTPLPAAPQVLEHVKQIAPIVQPLPQAGSAAPASTTVPTLAAAGDPSAATPQPVPTPTAPPTPLTATQTGLTETTLAPITHESTVTAPVATAAGPLVGLPHVSQGSAQSSSQGGSGSDRGNTTDHGRHTADKIAPVAADRADVQAAPVSDTALVAAAANAVPISATPLPTSVGPSAVVSQIARHADLIRLPGNRGLRIQLHPEDLGGVQVTVRYSPTGGVELHINAEHAATGALVQAGWAELRDSLATQGISADRLMMSVTTPASAGQSDHSGGGGNRSDPGSYSSNQSSLNNQDNQGQSRQDTPPQRASQGWTGPLDPISSPDGDPRVAPSRIDYRA